MQTFEAGEGPKIQWIDVQKAYFIPWEGLELIHHQIKDMMTGTTKRARQAAFRQIVKSLKTLNLVGGFTKISGLSLGVIGSTGERGLFIQCTIDSQIRNL